VLVPWAEIEPAAVLPGHGPIAGLLAHRPADEIATVRRTDFVLH
jgi:2-amino-4-hydroxy-6-hydroxymethyldihydropteridine diphosphokinase